MIRLLHDCVDCLLYAFVLITLELSEGKVTQGRPKLLRFRGKWHAGEKPSEVGLPVLPFVRHRHDHFEVMNLLAESQNERIIECAFDDEVVIVASHSDREALVMPRIEHHIKRGRSFVCG